MNPKLQDAVAIFKALGWEDVTLENVLHLPLGTKDQKQTALSGLRSGEWGDIAQLKEGTYGWRSYIDVDEGKLAVFAVRIGVDAQRAANILFRTSSDILVAVIAERGAKYASDFIGYACVSSRRMHEHTASTFGNVAVQLVDRLDLEIPQTVGYMKDWSAYAAAAMGLPADIFRKETGVPSLGLIERRFAEHILTGTSVNAPATGPFGMVLPAGVKRGWLPREKAVELVFLALDAAVRPGDRKVWLNVLDELGITDDELCARAQAFIPLLATGDTAVVTRLAPPLIVAADSGLLAEVLLAAFSVTAKKAKKLVLKAALARPCPQNAEELAPWLSLLAEDTDKAIVSLSAQLIERWGLDAVALPEEDREIRGLWQATPPVWQVPSFDLGEVSPEALTELAAKLVRQPWAVHDVTMERFWAMANAVAYQSPASARTSLRGLRSGQSTMDFMVYWVAGEKPNYGFDRPDREPQSLLIARDYIVSLHLGALPCLLSTPSTIDLSITVPALAARLALYQNTSTDVLEADLLLALTRLDVTTSIPEAVQVLRQVTLPVVLQSGESMPIGAGEAVLLYLEHPTAEPALTVSEYGYWHTVDILPSEGLRHFPNRLARSSYDRFSTSPHWRDGGLVAVKDSEGSHEQGLVLRQVARRAAPLPPGASINFLAAQRSASPDAAEDSLLAVTEAWDRGLLRPGVADIALLDWRASPPSNLAAFASALDGIANDGLLSVVWPILDGLMDASVKAPRLLAGTAELAQLVLAFLPEVQFAIEQGLADDTALDLPGIWALAQRGGTSRAVSTAREITALLPAVEITPPKGKNPLPVMDPPFDEIWPTGKEVLLPIDDGGTVTVDWADPTSPKKLFLFTLALPGISDRVFHVVNRGWHYDLDHEGQCRAYTAAPDATAFTGNGENQVWLHWDIKHKSIAVCENRNWIEGTNGPLSIQQPPPLSSSLLTVVIGLLAQDGDAIYFAPRMLRQLIQSEEIGEEMVRKATQTLLQSPVISPGKLVRTLEKDIKLLHVLWPMLTECIKFVGTLVTAGNAPPVWSNRILGIALRYAPYLAEAAERGLIPPEDAQWVGLAEIASSKSKSKAVIKAKELWGMFG